MSTIAIEINDSGILLADASGVLATAPGYALVEDNRIVTGAAAYAASRLHPRRSSNRFWDALSLAPGSAGIDGVGSSAELAYAQLAELWAAHGGEGHDALFLVPGHYGREQLGILLGLAHECGIEVRSMISAAAAAATAPYPGLQLLHVDAGLHRVSVTPLRQADDVEAQPEQSLTSAGLASLQDLLAKRIAELFVLATRYDPFHSAASEQRVYDGLSGWLQELGGQSEKLTLRLARGDDELSVDVGREQLIGAMTGFYRAIVQLIAQCREPGAPAAVLLSSRIAVLPGLVAELERLDDAHVVIFDPAQSVLAILGHAAVAAGDGGSVRLLKRLPWRAPPVAVDAVLKAPVETPRQASANGSDASHIVYRGTAYPVDSKGILIGREATSERRTIVLNGGQTGVSRIHCELVRRDGELRLVDRSRFGTFVNEKRVSGEVSLQPADVIRIGSPGEQLQVICVERADGP
jgi:hypothetical protein